MISSSPARTTFTSFFAQCSCTLRAGISSTPLRAWFDGAPPDPIAEKIEPREGAELAVSPRDLEQIKSILEEFTGSWFDAHGIGGTIVPFGSLLVVRHTLPRVVDWGCRRKRARYWRRAGRPQFAARAERSRGVSLRVECSFGARRQAARSPRRCPESGTAIAAALMRHRGAADQRAMP